MWANAACPLDWPLRFRDHVIAGPFVGNDTERTTDLAKAVHVLRQHGVAVSFPMRTAEGEIIFAVGEDSTLTADQILELMEREELHAEGVRRLVEAENQRRLATLRRQAASS